jgi:acyl-CoA reductase-like NAD-dependent aldehyde dehydrogenase
MTRIVTSRILGKPVDGAPGGTLTNVNPGNVNDVVAEVRLGDASTFLAAARAAKATQLEWRKVPSPVRGRAIQQIGRIVEANKEALSQLITQEIGKPIAESRGEVQEVIDTADFFLGEGRRLYGQTVPSEMPDKQLFTFRRPVGAVAVITAGNFPAAVPAWYIIPALLTGNTVIWKPAEYAAAVAQAFVEILEAGGLPQGAINLVLTDGPTTFSGLEQALAEGTVDKVGFTGSSAVGTRIGELTGRHLQTACLELGGKNPMVVMDDAELDLAVEGALFSGFGTSGQRCTSLGTAIVHEDVYDEFVRRFMVAVQGAVVGDATSTDVLYGPMMNQRFASTFDGWLGLVQDHHIVGGSSGTGRITSQNPREGFIGDPDTGIFYHPTVVAGVTLEDELYRNETFGPLVGIAKFSTWDEAMALANNHGFGLSSSIYTTSMQHAFRFREQISAGMVSINNSTSGAEAHLPFGGNGKSGNGSRQSGIWVIDQFTSWQSMNVDFSGKLQKAQMDVMDVEADLDFRLA